MKKFAALLGLTGVLALNAVAQDPAAAPAPAPAADVTVTTETSLGTPIDNTTESTVIGVDDAGTLPTTGGAPIAMALAGALTAGSAFFLRRKWG